MDKEDKTMIKNEYRVTKKVYLSWVAEGMFKGTRLVMTIVWCVFALCMGVMAAISYLQGFCILMMLFGIYRAFGRIFVISNRQYKLLAEMYGAEEGWLRTITFEEEEIVLSEGRTTVKYAYKDIIEVQEKDNKIWLKAVDKTVIRMYKDCFVEGTWEECKQLLQAK